MTDMYKHITDFDKKYGESEYWYDYPVVQEDDDGTKWINHHNHGKIIADRPYITFDFEKVPGYVENQWKPTKKTSVLLISLSNIYNTGVRCIHAALLNAGYDAHLLFFGYLLANDYKEATDKDWDDLVDLINKIDPAYIGISVACSSYYTQAITMSELIKEKFPDKPLIWGSIHAIIDPDQSIQHADIVCTGEGEMCSIELADRFERGLPYDDIPDFWIKKPDGTIIKNETRPVSRDLDSIPYPIWDHFNKWSIRQNLYEQIDPAIKEVYIFIMTSRGCPYFCNYCINSIYHKKFKKQGFHKMRQRSVNSVMEELRIIRKNFPKFERSQIAFFDDIFTISVIWIKEFSRQYKREFSNLFWCYFHPMLVKEEMVDALMDIGLSHIDIGIQTGSDRIRRKLMKRPESNEVILNMMHLLKKKNISVVFDVITDIPFETDEDYKESLEFYLSMPGPYSFNFYSLIYFPKVEMTEMALAHGFIKREDVEDLAGKTLDQFVSTFAYREKRKPRDRFYLPLFHLAGRRVFPTWFVRWLAGRGTLRKSPWILEWLVSMQSNIDIFRKMLKLPYYMATGRYNFGKLAARIQLYLSWERPYDK